MQQTTFIASPITASPDHGSPMETDDSESASFSLQVQREELRALPAGRAVYVRKSKLFFKSTTKDALERNAAASDAATAAPADPDPSAEELD